MARRSRGFTSIALACSLTALGAPSVTGQAGQALIPSPLTYDAALNVATSRNLRLDAARRARLIREAGIRTAGRIPNPDVTLEVGRDTPHEVVSFNLPVEIGGVRSR